MSAWSILISNSTVPVGSIAWDHLNNQAGGGGDIYLSGGVELQAELNINNITANVSKQSAYLALEEISLNVESETDAINIIVDELSIKHE